MDVNQKRKPSSDEPKKMHAAFLLSWMTKLGAAFRQEVSMETQAMYLQALADLPQNRLEAAFQQAVRECRFFPTVAEIRAFEREVKATPEQLDAAYERLKLRIANQPKALPYRSVLTDPEYAQLVKFPAPRQLTDAEVEERLAVLRAQLDRINIIEA